MDENRKKILIADDHKIIRDGIRAMLEEFDGVEVVAEATDGEEVLEVCRSRQIDVIIMDINMSGINGIEATRLVTEEFSGIKVLALTMMQEEEHIRRMIKAGASGYILKTSGSEELKEAVDTILEGENYFSKEATNAVMKDLAAPEDAKQGVAGPEELTDREREVLQLICSEFTNKEIAEKLYISVRTVDAHRRNLLQKTGARNTAGLVRYAMEHDLI